jgi:hypothetical protein
LLSPLYYSAAENNPADCNPFSYKKGDGEKLFCFMLNENECYSFEPDKKALLGSLIFSAYAVTSLPGGAKKAGEALQALPEGKYLFAQKREIMNREEILDMAVEIQAEGLWRRLKPGKTLYLRYVFEDSATATQLFRPCT